MPAKTNSRPYQASFANRYFDWVDRLPLPYWLYYLLLYIASTLITLMIVWISGIAPVGEIRFAAFVGGIWWVLESGTIHYLDHLGRRQMQKFKPMINKNIDFEDLEYRIYRMPAKTINLLTFILALAIGSLALLQPNSLLQGEGSNIKLGFLSIRC